MKYLLVFLCLLFNLALFSQSQIPPYTDTSHFSQVFGHQKFYRIYLPGNYKNNSERFPVIYFFHGWGGRHFKDDNALLEYTMIKDLVDKYRVILVMWDGNIEESQPRPYNIGNHKDIRYPVQMKDYFPELVEHIDSKYRTLSDRSHRGIIGFSMGGIMSFFLAGKYPDKVCSAVNLAGTPEFFIGYPENHTLYQVRYTFKNLMEVPVRQQGGDRDILVYLNEEVQKGAQWEGNPYEFYGFHGGHMVDKPGETKAFEMAMKFVCSNFGRPFTYPSSWSHYDLYNQFSVWDYNVNSNKNIPGFIFLRNVTKHGMGVQTLKWLPDGPSLRIPVTITTAPLYVPGKAYQVIHFINDNSSMIDDRAVADKEGRLGLSFGPNDYETAIFLPGDIPEPAFLRYSLQDNKKLLETGDNDLYIQLYNRGGDFSGDESLAIRVQSCDKDVVLYGNEITMKPEARERILILPAIRATCGKTPPMHAEPSQVKFKVTIQSGDTTYADEVIVPVLFNAPAFDSIRIDDGRVIREKAFGKGNADGTANAGESIMVYKSKNRLRLYTNDPWINRSKEELMDEQIPSIWEDGYALSSVVTISPDCPDGHVIEFTGDYETNSYNPIERKLHWGTLKIKVSNPKTKK
ncbi:MAG TPA: alpha/beta fold hydrolase [Bacteroidales bacterium]|nr:alpha/beta fold hydrolase [Bacteroidales bacterium]